MRRTHFTDEHLLFRESVAEFCRRVWLEAGKGGILAFTRTVAKELIQQNVRVNAIAPGFVDTQLVSGALTEPLVAAVVMQTPQGRLGRPEEVAAAVSFLATDDASFFVGDTISPNGGFVTS